MDRIWCSQMDKDSNKNENWKIQRSGLFKKKIKAFICFQVEEVVRLSSIRQQQGCKHGPKHDLSVYGILCVQVHRDMKKY